MMAYTYLIGWKSANIWYYGVRWSATCEPNDLWVTYFTSSQHVSATRARLGEPDIRQVRRTFALASDARIWEHRVLRRMKAVKSVNWLNLSDGHYYHEGPHSTEHRAKIRAKRIGVTTSLAGTTKSAATKQKMSESRKALGIVMTASTKTKISAAALARPFRAMGPMSEETKAKISAANAGKPRAPHSEETRRKISESQRGRPGRFGDDNPSRNPDVAAKISKTLTGRIRTEAEREAIRNGCVGRVMPKRGPMSEETKAKIRDGHLRSKQPKG